MALEVDFWDVGQGDCSVIRLPGNQLLIIDVGSRTSPLPDWLAERPRDSIYGIVLTHNDDDHAGCLPAILDLAGSRIAHVFMLEDRHMSQPSTRRLVGSVLKWHRDFGGSFHRIELQAGSAVMPIFGQSFREIGDLVVYAVHPDFSTAIANQTRKHPDRNKVSAILCLDIDGVTKFVWAGDAPMSALASTCSDKRPTVLVGPHHGGPVDRGESGYPARFDRIHPDAVFISVGTKNKHKHPVKKFIDLHRSRGRTVCCSELVHCDRLRVQNRKHVLSNHYELGFIPPPHPLAVTCRGPMRYTWDAPSREFHADRFQSIHLDALRNVKHPYCLNRSDPSQPGRP